MNRIKPKRWQPKFFWSLLLGLLVFWGWSNGAMPARAHALMLRSIPRVDAQLSESPHQIEMWFTEPLEEGLSQVRLLNSAGQRFPIDPPLLDRADPTHLTLSLESLPPGIYTVAWKNLSRADGHTWTGSFPFTVLKPDGSPPIGSAATPEEINRQAVPTSGDSLARWLALLGGTLFFGAPLFQWLVVSRAQNSITTGLPTSSRNLALRVVWVATIAVIVSAWLQILLQTLQLGGLQWLPILLLEARTGVLALMRQILALSGLLLILNLPQPRPLQNRDRTLYSQLVVGGLGIGLLLLLTMARTNQDWPLILAIQAVFGLAGATLLLPRDNRANERNLWPALLILGAVLLFTFSSGSHARAVPGSGWTVLVDYLHLIAAATWIGGLMLLTMLAWQVRQAKDSQAQLLRLVQRFSYLATVSIFVLAVTGLFSSVVQIPELAAVVQTSYGWVLLAKLSLVGLALLVALLNNRTVHRRGASLQRPLGRRRFSRQLAVEAVASLGVMLSVAVLTQTNTARNVIDQTAAQQASVPFHQIVKADDLNIDLQIDPNRIGPNTFKAHLYNDENSDIGQVQLVRLIFEYQDEQLGQTKTDLVPHNHTDFATTGAYLNQSGDWKLSVYVRRRGVDDLLADFNVNVPPLPGSTPRLKPWQNPVPGLPIGLLLAGLIVATGTITLVWRGPWQRFQALVFLIKGVE